MYSTLHPLRIARFNFTIQPTEEILLPDYKGAALRGGFGFAFKKATCLSRDRQCGPCMLKTACAYYTVFETKVPKRPLNDSVSALMLHTPLCLIHP